MDIENDINRFRSIFPIRHNGADKNSLDLCKLQNIYTLLDDLQILFPQLAQKSKLLCLYIKGDLLFTKIMKNILHFR